MELVPIATLAPSISFADTKSFKGVVTLVWPYSSSARQYALLLAEQDFRLRRQKGQIRVQFGGASAKAVARSRIGIGDVVTVGLEGVQWVQEEAEQSREPEQGVDWELRYEQRLVLQARREEEHLADINVDNPTPSPEPEPTSTIPNGLISQEVGYTNVETPAVRKSFPLSSGTWASPAFLRQSRVSSGNLVDSPYDPFTGNKSFLEDRSSKRRKQWHEVTQWKFADKPPSSTVTTLWNDIDVENWEEDPQATIYEMANTVESPLPDLGAGSMNEPFEITTLNTDVHDFALHPRKNSSKDGLLPVDGAAPSVQDRPSISIQTVFQPAESTEAAVLTCPEIAPKSQMGNIHESMLPPSIPNSLDAESRLLSPEPPPNLSARPQTPKLTAVPSSALPLPSPFPAEGHNRFVFPSESGSQGSLPSPVTGGAMEIDGPRTPHLKAISSFNLPLPSPFPTEGPVEPNNFFVSEDSQVTGQQQHELGALQLHEENASPKQASQTAVPPDKDFTWKPDEPIQSQPQTEELTESSQPSLPDIGSLRSKMRVQTSEPSVESQPQSSDQLPPSSLSDLNHSDFASVQLHQTESESLSYAERRSQPQTNVEEEKGEMSPRTPTPPPRVSLEDRQSQFRGSTPSSAIEISAEEESSEMGDDRGDDVIDEDTDEDEAEEEEEEDEDIELEERSEGSEEELEASLVEEYEHLITNEHEDPSEASPGIASGSSSRSPSAGVDQSDSDISRFEEQLPSIEYGHRSQTELATTNTGVYPLLDEQGPITVAQGARNASPFGFDGGGFSAAPFSLDDGATALPGTKEVPETVQEDELNQHTAKDSQALSPDEFPYVFEDGVPDESDNERSFQGVFEQSSPIASESAEADEEESVPLSTFPQVDERVIEQNEISEGIQASEETSASKPTRQTVIVDLGSSSDAEMVNDDAARAIRQEGLGSSDKLAEEQQASIADSESQIRLEGNEIIPEDDAEAAATDGEVDSQRSSRKDVDVVEKTQSGDLQNPRMRPLTPGTSQQTTTTLQDIPENDSLNRASMKVLPPTPQLTQPSQDKSLGLSHQSPAPPVTKYKTPTRRSARVSQTPQASARSSQEQPSSSPSSQKTQKPTRRSTRISSVTPQPRPRTPEIPLPSTTSPPSKKKTPSRRSERLSSSPAQMMYELSNDSVHISSASAAEITSTAADKTPTRRSERVRQRQPPLVHDVPEAISPWFGPRRSNQTRAQAPIPPHSHLPPTALKSDKDALVIPDSEETATPITTSSPSFSQSTVASGTSSKRLRNTKLSPIPSTSLPASSHPSSLGLRTSYAYYTPLASLPTLLNALPTAHPSVLGLARTPSRPPERAASGPKDWFTQFSITDPASHENRQSIMVRVFRPFRAALPQVEEGDPVLLREFDVRGRKGQILCVSGEASAWCVWRMQVQQDHAASSSGKGGSPDAKRKGRRKAESQGGSQGAKEIPMWTRRTNETGFTVWEKDKEGDDVLGREEITGPPVEFGDEERDAARALREWWIEEGLAESGQEKVKKGTDDKSDGGKEGGKKINGTIVHELRDGLLYQD